MRTAWTRPGCCRAWLTRTRWFGWRRSTARWSAADRVLAASPPPGRTTHAMILNLSEADIAKVLRYDDLIPELDDAAMHSTLILDSREAVLKESGDVILSKAPIFAEAGEIFAGRKSPLRSATTVFKSVRNGALANAR